MKHRLSRFLVILLLAAIALFFPLLASPHRIDEAHRDLIREGLTAAEVESIFGVPAGTYDWAVVEDSYIRYHILIRRAEQLLALEDQKLVVPLAAVEPRRKRPAATNELHSWTSRHGSVTIGFDENGLVSWVSGWHKVRVEPPWKKWWDKIRGK